MLSAILAAVCWQQQQTISTFEQDKTLSHQEIEPENSSHILKQAQIIEQKSKQKKKVQSIHEKNRFVQEGQDVSVSKDDLEAMVEDRAWERIEEIEEDRRQERFERMSEYMQTKVDAWTEDFDWSEEVQASMMDVMTTYIQGRIDFHEQLKNGTIEREGIGPYFKQLSEERNEAIIELIGEEQFLDLEDELKHRGGPR